MKHKIVYQETYKSSSAWLKEQCLPTLKHLTPGFRVKAAKLTRSGRFENGIEFHDMRILIEEINKPES